MNANPFFDAMERTELFAESASPPDEQPEPSPALSDCLVHLDAANDDDEQTSIVEKLVPEGEVALFAGHGGAGKSFVALLLAIFVTLGRNFAGLWTKPVKVLFFSCEDSPRVLRKRVRRICSSLGVDPSSLKDRLFLLDASDVDPALHRGERQQSVGTQLLGELQKLVEQLDVGLIVIDGASDTFDGDEIRRAHVRAFLRDLRMRLARPDRAVLLLAHVSKTAAINPRAAGGQDFSGSTAWHNSVRSRLTLRPDGQDGLIVEHQKSNYGALSKPIRLKWVDGCPVVTDPESSASKGDDSEEIKVSLITVLSDFDLRGERVPVAMQGHSTAFKTMSGHRWFPPGLASNDFAVAMRALETDGRIFRRSVRKPDRKMVEVFTTQPPECAQASVNQKESEG
ncbi:MAG: AAA family ATPase [Magnetococcales bacterium]|nr:AAA family ATPase [Magnetococcales bacterium]